MLSVTEGKEEANINFFIKKKQGCISIVPRPVQKTDFSNRPGNEPRVVSSHSTVFLVCVCEHLFFVLPMFCGLTPQLFPRLPQLKIKGTSLLSQILDFTVVGSLLISKVIAQLVNLLVKVKLSSHSSVEVGSKGPVLLSETLWTKSLTGNDTYRNFVPKKYCYKPATCIMNCLKCVCVVCVCCVVLRVLCCV